jgi:hypothetical protein
MYDGFPLMAEPKEVRNFVYTFFHDTFYVT